MILLGRAGRPYPRHVSDTQVSAPRTLGLILTLAYLNPTTGFCAENPTKEHICKNKQLLHFKSINHIPPFNKPAGKPGAAAAKRDKR